MNKKGFLFKLFGAHIFGALVFTVATGCAPQGPPPGADLVVAVASGDYRYVDLETGTVLEAGAPVNDAGWDLKFSYDRQVFTNSGDTAADEGSGGLGGVYYVSGASSVDEDLSAALTAAKEIFDDPGAEWDTHRHTDKKAWVNPAPTQFDDSQTYLNAMTFLGYGTGDGTESSVYSDYQYDQNQFYNADTSGMPPKYTMTNNIYIIRHGDGTKHTAIQVTAMDQVSGNRQYGIEVANLD
jgi:hypothetical protein